MFCIALLATLCLRVGLAQSAEFRSIGDAPAIVYDAPSLKAKKLFVASRDYPLEVIVNIEGWVKVRDAAGDLFWVEKKVLSERRMLLVSVPLVDVRQAAVAADAVIECLSDRRQRLSKAILLELPCPRGDFALLRRIV